MDAELSLITANLAHASPGKIVYDPFVGTGSFLISCAHFGALTMGSDIDGRTIRGTKKGKSIKANFEQYGLTSQYMDCFVGDLTHSPFRETGSSSKDQILDAIVCDPPYGVREGLKVLGSRDPNTPKEPVLKDGKMIHLYEPNTP